MHGRVKTRTSAEEAERKAKERAKKVIAYRAGISKALEKRSNGELDKEALDISGKLLFANPDIYTMWNMRKQIVLHMVEQIRVNGGEETDVQKLFEDELLVTEQCLYLNPKSYGAWHHRCWVMDTCPSPDWTKELTLCTKYLKLDERNFHCWDYRRYIVSKAKISPSSEFEFSTLKIQDNFSNYSSWHYRSNLLPVLYPAGKEGRQINEDKLQEELEMVQNAAFTDPNDTSAWFYQRWLLGKADQPLDLIVGMVTPWSCLIALSQPACCENTGKHKLILKVNHSPIPGTWKCNSEYLYDTIWDFVPKEQILSEDIANVHIEFELLDSDGEVLNTLAVNNVGDGRFVGFKKVKFGAQFGAGIRDELKTQLDSCKQLLELEPDSKWTLLTSALIMRTLDNRDHHGTSLQTLRKLCEVDPLRKGYYSDLASRWLIELAIDNWLEDSDSLSKGSAPKLRGLGLTALYYTQYMCLAENIDLSDNLLTERSVLKFADFRNCQALNLESNHFNNVPKFPMLSPLTRISL